MAKNVENRIVEMQFDNRQFESGVKESLSTIDKLKKALNFEGASKGFTELEKSAKNCDIGIIGSAAEKVGQKFSVMEVAAITAIANITNKAVNAGEQLIKSLSIDQVTAGWQKFTDITNSAGTLINQGFSSKQVYGVLEKLNWFTDETSYNLTDMVSNISKFTASGQGLDESAQAMMGIATWAALSGQNAQKASMAMYQLSQAMGKGVLKYDDWKSIQNANMDTLEFRNKALEAAEAVGILQKQSDGLYKTLSNKKFSMQELFSSEAMSKQAWFTKDVMMTVFSQYSSAVDAMHEFSSEYGINATEIFAANEKLSEGIDKFQEYVTGKDGMGITNSHIVEELQAVCEGLDEFGVRAFRAAQEARSWADVVDSVKDAVSTGWMNTFQIIFGKYDEAKELWSTLAESMYNVFAEGGERRNLVLTKWSEWGGQRYFIDTIYTLINAVENSIGKVREWWRAAFQPDSSKQVRDLATHLLLLTKRIHDFIAGNKFSKQSLDNMRDAVQGVAAIFKIFKQTLSNIFGVIKPFGQTLNTIGGVILSMVGSVGRAVQNFEEWYRTSDKVQKVFEKFRKGSEYLNVVLRVLVLSFKALAGGIKSSLSSIKQLSIFEKIGKGFAKVGEVMLAIVGLLTVGVVNLVDSINEFFNKTNSDDAKPESNFFSKLLDHIKTGATFVAGAVIAAGIAVKDFLVNLKNNGLNAIRNLWDSVTSGVVKGVASLKEKFVELVDWFKNSKLGQFLEPLFERLKGIIPLVKEFALNLKDLATKENLAKAAVIAITATLFILLNNVSGAVSSIKKLADTMSGFFTNTIAAIKKLAAKNSKIMDFAKAVAIMAGSIYLLSKIPKDDLKEVVKQVGILTAIIGGAAIAIMSVQRLLGLIKTTGKGLDISGMGPTMVAFSASIVILVGALYLLQQVPMENIWAKVGVMGTVMAELMAISILIGKFGGTGKIKGTVFVIAFAFAMSKIAESLQKLQTYNFTQMWDAIKSMTAIIAGTSLMMSAIGKIGVGSFVGMAALALALKFFKDDILVGIEAISNKIIEIGPSIKEAMLGQAHELPQDFIYTVIALTASLIGLTVFVSRAAGNVAKSLTSVIVMFASVLAMIAIVTKLADKYPEAIGTAVGAVAGMLITISGLIAALSLVTGTKDAPKKVASLLGTLIGISVLMGVMVGLIAITTKLVGKESFWPALGAMEGLLALIGVIGLVSSQAKGSAVLPIIGFILALSTVMASLAYLMLLANDAKTYIAGLVGLGIILGGLTVVFNTMAKMQSASIKIASVAATIGVLGGVIAGLYALLYFTADNMPDHILDALLEMGAICVALVVAVDKLKMLNISPKDAAGIAISLGSLTACVASLGLVISYVANNIGDSWAEAIGVTVGIVALVAVLSTAMYYMAKYSKQYTAKKTVEIGKSLLEFTTVIALLTGVIYAITKIKGNIWEAYGLVAALTGLVVVVGALLVVAANSLKGNIKIQAIMTALFEFTAMIGIFAAMIWAITEIKGNIWEAFGLLSAITGIFILIGGLLAVAAAFLPQAAIIPVIGLIFVELGVMALSISASMLLLAKALEAFDALPDAAGLANKFWDLAPALAVFGAACLALIPGSVGMVLGAAGILALTGALALFGLLNMDKISDSVVTMSGALAGVAVSLTIFSLALGATAVVLALASPAMILASAAILIFAGALVALNAAFGSLSWLSDKFHAFFDEMAEAATFFAEGIKEGLKNSVGSIKDAVGDFCQSMADKFRNFFGIHSPSDYMADMGEFLVLGLEEGIKNETPGAVKAVEKLSEETANALDFDKIKDCFANFAEDVAEKGLYATLKDDVEKAKEVLGDFDIATLFENIGSDIPIISDFKDQIADMTGALGDNSDGANKDAEALGKVGSAAAKAKTPVEELTDSLRNSVNMFEEFQNGDELDPEQLLKNMQSQISGLADWGNKFSNLADMGYNDAVLDEIKKMGTAGTNKVDALLKMTDEQIAQINDLFLQKEIFSNHVAQQVEDSMRYVGEMAVKGFSDALDPYSTIIKSKQLGDSLIETLEKELDIHSPSRVMQKEGMFVIQGLEKGLKENMHLPQIAMYLVSQKLMLVADAWFSIERWTDIGRHIGDGLIAGIDESMSDAVAEAELLAYKIYAAAKNALGIKSPSRKFAELGRYSAEGFAVGLGDNEGVVKTAVEALADDSIDSLKSAIQRIADVVNGEIDTNPVITPMLDLSYLRKGTDEISSMFNSSRINVSEEVDDSTNQNGAKGNGMTFIQNNYSPKALSRTEIYRQTRNQFTAMRGVVGNV